MIMNNTARIQVVADLSIEVIKKAFIKRHQVEAANEHPILKAAVNSHVEAVKRWIAPLEFKQGVKAQVLNCANPGMSEDASAQVVDDKLLILANCIENEKQARDVFVYGAIGLVAIPEYLVKLGETAIEQIYNSLSHDQLESVSSQFGALVASDRRLVVGLHLADLATLDVKPTFLERRDSWQRQLVRKLYSKLNWTSHDLHYLIFRAARTA
jgi:hypothetical protein